MMRRPALLAGMFAVLLAAAPAAAQDKNKEKGADAKAEAAEADVEAVGESGEESTDKAAGDAEAASDTETQPDSTGMADSGGMGEEPGPSETAQTDTGGEMPGAEAGHASTTNMFVAAPHIGVTVPSLFSDLGPWPLFGAEIGFMPGIENRPLEIALQARYSKPVATGGGEDRNLGEGGGQSYEWELNQRTVTLDLVGMWRFRKVSAKLHPYVMGGPRVNLMESVQTATGNGSDFGETRETNTEFGLVVGGGVDYQLGPGTMFSELKFGWTNLDQELTGNSNAGELVLDVGYRFYPF